MLILGDISGIQDYLFDVAEEGGGQARRYRARSFRIQLLAECVALRVRLAAGLGADRLLFGAAAKFALDAEGLDAAGRERANGAATEVNDWLLHQTRGQLRLTVVAVEYDPAAPRAPQSQYDAGLRKLHGAKLRAWSGLAVRAGRWEPSRLCLNGASGREAEGDDDEALGKALPTARWLVVEAAGAARREPAEWRGDVAGLAVSVQAGAQPVAPGTLLSYSRLAGEDGPAASLGAERFQPRRLARHVPVEGGRPVEFVELAARSRGAVLLGVLKADADRLGAAVGRRLHGAADLRPLGEFSRALDDYFARDLDTFMGRPPWSDLYTVFSGGDDLLLVGPWDVVLDFAGHVRERFARRVRRGRPDDQRGAGVRQA